MRQARVVRTLPTLEPLEAHSGIVTGPRRSPAPPADDSPNVSAVKKVLEELLLPALSRSPCLLAFSGGRDSSVMLVMATQVARRHGLEDPVPITFRYDQHPRTWEAEWQELTVRHLGLDEWEVISIGSEFDALGPLARDALLRHGLYWPANAHAMVPLLRAATHGALITGNGGDEVFNSLVEVRRLSLTRAARLRPLRRAVVTGFLLLLPDRWGTRLSLNRGLRLPWLRPVAKREVRRRIMAEHDHANRNPTQHLGSLNDSRYLELAGGIFTALARDAGVELYQPFLEPRFIKAALAAAPPDGFLSRGAALEAFFEDLLPHTLAQRSTKASFTEVFWGPDSRDFARRWDGTGLDLSLIDPEELRHEWSKSRPDFRSITPLQAAWLAWESTKIHT